MLLQVWRIFRLQGSRVSKRCYRGWGCNSAILNPDDADPASSLEPSYDEKALDPIAFLGIPKRGLGFGVFSSCPKPYRLGVDLGQYCFRGSLLFLLYSIPQNP